MNTRLDHSTVSPTGEPFGRPSADAPLSGESAPRLDQLCLVCGKPFVFGPKSKPAANVYSIDGKKEVAITQTCERCFDAMFEEDDA